jgi:hypothetical protein
MRDFAVFDVAAHLYYLEPSKVVDRFRRFIKRSPYRLVTSGRGTTGNLYSFEYFTLHDCPPVIWLEVNLHLLFPPSIGLQSPSSDGCMMKRRPAIGRQGDDVAIAQQRPLLTFVSEA